MDEALVQSFFDLWELKYSAGAVKNMRLPDYHIMLSLAILTAMLWNHMREELGEAMLQLRFFLVNVNNGRCINISMRPSRELSLPSVWYRPDIGEQISCLSSNVLEKWLAIKEGMSVTLDEIRCSSARRVRKPRLAFSKLDKRCDGESASL
jgi:hypothetical protein